MKITLELDANHSIMLDKIAEVLEKNPVSRAIPIIIAFAYTNLDKLKELI